MTKSTRPLLRGVWIDDDMEAVRGWVPLFLERGIDLEVVSPDAFHVSAFLDRDIVTFDLENKIFRRDGLAFARQSTLQNPNLRVLFVSRHLNSGEDNLELDRRLNPTTAVGEISKITLARASRSSNNEYAGEKARAVELIDETLRRMEEQFHRSVADFSKHPMINVDSNFDAFAEIDRLSRSALVLQAARHFESPLSVAFASRPELQWLVLGVPTGELLLWGGHGDDPPRTRVLLKKLAESALSPCVPITFNRPRSTDN